ncbi:hypothetical protein AWB74_03721 [Caballeronia arvi]|uniref:Glycosyltransferase RgtA/B/C/D-like domain-containing protein n=1 Tax=Caballeronia arvi TaxID=1777135 RepID=A0A158JCJ4_9BURK|nr:hypothetical protein [Caballeronia arvi]SAL66415.1 hypothetical protein AWB74_03721 [Caballeronia arvi]
MLSSRNGVRSSRPFSSSVFESVGGAILLCGLAFLLQHRYGFGWADEGLLWYDSQRTSLGGVPLRDYYGYDPGRYYWVSVFFHLLGRDGLHELLVANAAFGALGLAAVWLAMCTSGMRFGWRLSAAILLTMALGYPRHKVYEQSLSLILVACVFYVLVKSTSARRWMIFGILTGLAAFIGRNSGVYFVGGALISGLVVVLTRSPASALKSAAYYSAGVVVGYAPMLLLLAFVPGMWSAFVESVLFLPHWQLRLPIPFPWRISIAGIEWIDAAQRIAISIACVLVPLYYAAGLICTVIERRRATAWFPPAALTAAGCIAGIAYLYQSFDRADFGHIANGLLPAFVAVFAGAFALHETTRARVLSLALPLCFGIVAAACWLPYEPALQFARARQVDPHSVADLLIDGKSFEVYAYQAETLTAVKQAAARCGVDGHGLLAAPHFPGVYAFLNAKAPFWEMYYLYPRSIEFQRMHIRAIADTRVILLAPDATIDGLEGLKLKNTYGELMKFIESRYTPLDVALPNGYKLYALPNVCR